MEVAQELSHSALPPSSLLLLLDPHSPAHPPPSLARPQWTASPRPRTASTACVPLSLPRPSPLSIPELTSSPPRTQLVRIMYSSLSYLSRKANFRQINPNFPVTQSIPGADPDDEFEGPSASPSSSPRTRRARSHRPSTDSVHAHSQPQRARVRLSPQGQAARVPHRRPPLVAACTDRRRRGHPGRRRRLPPARGRDAAGQHRVPRGAWASWCVEAVLSSF